jgi:hypothetical protein
LTADKHGVQKRLAFCPFGDQEQETAVHLSPLLLCSKGLWMMVHNWVQSVRIPSIHSPRTAAEIKLNGASAYFHQHGNGASNECIAMVCAAVMSVNNSGVFHLPSGKRSHQYAAYNHFSADM